MYEILHPLHSTLHKRRVILLLKLVICAVGILLLSQCKSINTASHELLISVPEQRALLLYEGKAIKTYPVSTSRFGVGNRRGSYRTPVGRFVVARKIGDRAPQGAVFKSRRATGEIMLPKNSGGRDPITTRILWLDGRENRTANSFRRYIYIHGTPQESLIGAPVSFGCVRMKNRDVIELYEKLQIGATVRITTAGLPL